MKNKELRKQLKEKVKDLIFDTQAEIVMNTPVDSGRLRNSIIVEEKPDGFIIGTNVPYAEFVEIDTEPHTIKPKNKKALRFEVGRKSRLSAGKSPKQANIVFAKVVHHPGTTGSHMFLKGVRFFENEMKRLNQ